MSKKKVNIDSLIWECDDVLTNIDGLTLTQLIARDYPNLCVVTEDAEFEIIQPKQLPDAEADLHNERG